MSEPELDVVVVGGGAVGLAVARAAARAGREVVLLEAEEVLGSHTSSRNSEVIHAGIYYPTGSLKARLCVEGRRALYPFCSTHHVDHRRTGKIIVATRDEELPVLERIHRQAMDNDVTDLEVLDAKQVASLEPGVLSVGGLLSPSTGIVDSHGFMRALRSDAEAAGAQVALASPFVSAEIAGTSIRVRVGGAEPAEVTCRSLVNSAGLWAQDVARKIDGLDPSTIAPRYLAKGHYFVLAGKNPFGRLVYPVPVPGGLGVHVTLDLAGQARFGPDVSWIDRIDYSFDEQRRASFERAIRSYFPALPDGALQPGYTGIRPKIVPAGVPAADFVIQTQEVHGVLGLVNLYGIESPGLTAALAIADCVVPALA